MEEHLPKKYYSISEVAEMLDLKPHILRFWETEFPQLRPRKNRAGNRAYVERDIKIVNLIRRLLYEEKYTIEGAKQRLKSDRGLVENQLSLPLDTGGGAEEKTKPVGISELKEIRGELLDLIRRVRSL